MGRVVGVPAQLLNPWPALLMSSNERIVLSLELATGSCSLGSSATPNLLPTPANTRQDFNPAEIKHTADIPLVTGRQRHPLTAETRYAT